MLHEFIRARARAKKLLLTNDRSARSRQLSACLIELGELDFGVPRRRDETDALDV